ncbi:MAG: hypothetical protein FJ144_27875 [Deltaproteobacteria bacterium]|nr:hypothetical protein [Deltaproteobacteria bacterium]
MTTGEQTNGAVATRRQSESAASLVRAAIGGPAQVAGKLQRLGRTIRLYLDRGEIDARLRRLEESGLIDRRPAALQIFFGSLDMLRFVIEPAARDYYTQKGISFGFHQLLRVLDDPVSMIDPTGFLSERDTIIGHVMQVVHLNPVYDLQLIQMFPDGLEELERQATQMVEGTHPRAGTIGAIVEDPAYHARLLEYVRRFREDPNVPPPVREEQTLRNDPSYLAAERTFATLPGFIAYCHRLPTSFPTLLRRYRALDQFPVDLAG